MFNNASLPSPPPEASIPTALRRLPIQYRSRSSFTPTVPVDPTDTPFSLSNVGYFAPAIASFVRLNGPSSIPAGCEQSWRLYYGVSWDHDKSHVGMPTLPLALWDSDPEIIDTYYDRIMSDMLPKSSRLSHLTRADVLAETELLMTRYHFKSDEAIDRSGYVRMEDLDTSRKRWHGEEVSDEEEPAVNNDSADTMLESARRDIETHQLGPDFDFFVEPSTQSDEYLEGEGVGPDEVHQPQERGKADNREVSTNERGLEEVASPANLVSKSVTSLDNSAPNTIVLNGDDRCDMCKRKKRAQCTFSWGKQAYRTIPGTCSSCVSAKTACRFAYRPSMANPLDLEPIHQLSAPEITTSTTKTTSGRHDRMLSGLLAVAASLDEATGDQCGEKWIEDARKLSAQLRLVAPVVSRKSKK